MEAGLDLLGLNIEGQMHPSRRDSDKSVAEAITKTVAFQRCSIALTISSGQVK